MNQQEPIRDARTLGIPKMLILGLQHMFAMFGATILVPIITGLSVQVTLICAGLGTLFFHLCTKFKVPAFLGSSFAFLGGFAAVKLLGTGVYANLTEAEKLPYACGGIVVAGLLYLIMAAVVKFVGIKRVMRFLPPVVTGPIIILIGLILAAGLDGIEHSLPLPEAVNRNLFHPSAAAGLDSLPRTLREAITVAGQSEFISRELPVALMNKYFEYQTQLCHDAEGAPDTESWERAHSFLII